MSNKLKLAIDAQVGEYNWFIAGGAAAYWHIEHYAQFGPRHLHDMAYYDSIHSLIFPTDFEGNAVKKVEFMFDGQYGPVKVELQEMSKDMFEPDRLVQVDGINVYDIDSIIVRYRTAQGKLEKRNTRIALLQIIKQGIGINEANVRGNMPRGDVNLGGQIAAGFKLRPTK